jgi:hypothetical protein
VESRNASSLARTAGWILLFAAQGHVGVTSAPGLPLKDLIERSQFILEARPIKNSSRIMTITFNDPTAEIPPLERKAYKFIRLGVMKNFLESDLPDTLTVFEGNTAEAVRAHRAYHASGESEDQPKPSYRSPIKTGTLAKQKTVILFLNQIVDDSLVNPYNRFELAAGSAYEKTANRKDILKLLPKKAAPEAASVP